MERWSRGWSHDIMKPQSSIVQPSIDSDFPHTPRHVTGGEIYSLAAEIYPVIFLHYWWWRRRGRRRRRFTEDWDSASTVNSWVLGRDAIWEESGGGDCFPLILPDLPALKVNILLPLFPLILFVLFNCLLPFGVWRKEKKKSRALSCAVIQQWRTASLLQHQFVSPFFVQTQDFAMKQTVGQVILSSTCTPAMLYFIGE